MGTVHDAAGNPIDWGDFYTSLGNPEAAEGLKPHWWLEPEEYADDNETTCDILLNPTGVTPREAVWPQDFCTNKPTHLCFDRTRIDWFPVCDEHAALIRKETGQKEN